jgi:subtilisin family serine protease
VIGNSRGEAFLDAHADDIKKDGLPAVKNAPLYPGIISSTSAKPMPVDFMLSVGSVFVNGDYASFATINDSLDLVAPGSWLNVLGKNGTLHGPNLNPTKSESIEGTSYSAAYVSGAAAAYIGKNGAAIKLDPLIVAQAIIKSTNPSKCKGCVGTTGLLDLEKLLK